MLFVIQKRSADNGQWETVGDPKTNRMDVNSLRGHLALKDPTSEYRIVPLGPPNGAGAGKPQRKQRLAVARPVEPDYGAIAARRWLAGADETKIASGLKLLRKQHLEALRTWKNVVGTQHD